MTEVGPKAAAVVTHRRQHAVGGDEQRQHVEAIGGIALDEPRARTGRRLHVTRHVLAGPWPAIDFTR